MTDHEPRLVNVRIELSEAVRTLSVGDVQIGPGPGVWESGKDRDDD